MLDYLIVAAFVVVAGLYLVLRYRNQRSQGACDHCDSGVKSKPAA